MKSEGQCWLLWIPKVQVQVSIQVLMKNCSVCYSMKNISKHDKQA